MKTLRQSDFEAQPTEPTIRVSDLIDPQNGLSYYLMPAPPPPFFWLTLADARGDASGPHLRAIEEKLQRDVVLSEGDYIDYLRLRGREDLYFFAKECMGFNWLQWHLHAPIAWAWQAPNGWVQPTGQRLTRFRWAAIPRGHLKTTLLTQAYALWRTIRNTEERILILTHSDGFAQDVLAPVKMLLEKGGTHGEQFAGLYGDIVPAEIERGKKYDWNQHSITMVRKGNFTDPTIRAKGIESKITGGHYTLQLLDDLVGEELGRVQMDKLIRKFNNLTPLYHSIALGERRLVGTPWAFFDPLFYASKHWKNSMVARLSWADADNAMIFDKCNTAEAVGLKKRDPWFFSCQYECWPKDEEKIGFRREWFRYFRQSGDNFFLLDNEGREVKKIAMAACNFFLFVDPNTGRAPGDRASIKDNAPTNARHDYMGWIVLAVTPDNEWLVPRAIRWRCNPHEAIDKTYELIEAWKPQIVAIEQIASQYLWRYLFLNEWRRGRAPFNLVDWESGGAAKIEERIKGLIPFYSQGRVYHRDAELPEIAAGITALENELLDHPRPEYDDLSDALSAGIALAYAPGQQNQAVMRRLRMDAAFEDRIKDLDAGSRLEAIWLRRRANPTLSVESLFEAEM